MRLKSLEIKGFKSFADKTIVRFDEGITGIIGPNGCGKSNIIDSIRWVIGEQKISSLRSENLEALVFNGSKTRSASGLAEVSLTFENTRNLLPTEFSTVTITRRFYKNGDSEYRLNDVSCRLKDIHNLFMDTGVSTDSYAIIELGMVDDIIKDKENSRRRMLEQAAGITIYKTRKKEAKAKLESTEQDVNRIEDLLFEISNQLKTLENQAKKAEKYFEIKKEYKEATIELAKASLEGFNITYKDLQEKGEAELNKRAQLDAEIKAEEEMIEERKAAFDEKEKALQAQQQQFNELLQQIRLTENKKNLAAQKQQYLEEKKTSFTAFLSKAKVQIQITEQLITNSQTLSRGEEEKQQDLQQIVAAAKEDIEEKRVIVTDRRKELDMQRGNYQQQQKQQFDAEKKAAVADASVQNIQHAQWQINNDQQQQDAQLQQLERELEENEWLLGDKRNMLTDMQQHNEAIKVNIFEKQSQLEKLRNQLAEESRMLDARRNEYDLLKSLIDSMEGYPESVKFLHKNTNWNHKAPILSDIIYVDEEYRTAVENMLEPYLNYYIVNNWNEGLQAIHLLSDYKKGKANFFMLDKMGDVQTKSHQPVNTIRALEVIEVDEQYSKLAEYLLGNVFIAEDEDTFANSNGAVVLEKNGRYVKGKYTLSGGSIGLFEGKKIGRAKNLEKLYEEIIFQDAVVNSLKIDIKESQSEVVVYNEQMKANDTTHLQNEVNRLNNQAFTIKHKIENIHNTRRQATVRLKELEERLQSEHENIALNQQQLTDVNELLNILSDAIKKLEHDFHTAEQEYMYASAHYNENNLQLTRQQNKLSTLKQELSFRQNQQNELHSQIEQNTQQLQESAASINIAEEEVNQATFLLEQLVSNKQHSEVELALADKAYYHIRNELQVQESTVRLKIKSREIADQIAAQIKDKLNELKLQLAGMKERLHVEFKIELDDILDDPRNTNTPAEELQAASDRMKKRLENIGEINPTAVEAFIEMKKRYEFILDQKNDLVQAKQSLLQTIQEVEARANQQFLDTFNKVKDNFQRVFKALFTEEDTADLVLENPDNLAETGIDIIAKPKGKRPSSITQLSGGEKTLTATALLFSIYLIKPAPFCILDEVDAPLDDANVSKFTNMIKQFSENSQFIIVTHNKTTMSAVDVIYGVTMQEPGVSKLVPVDFRNLN